MSSLQIVCIFIMQVATIFGVTCFILAIKNIFKNMSVGRPAKDRLTPVIPRLKYVFLKVLSHSGFKNKPVVKVAHWLVMVSFPILVFTLFSGYAQLFKPDWVLPLLGHFIPWEILTELIAWLSMFGIIFLTFLRIHLNRKGSKSRFAGSNKWQAFYVEFTIFLVVGCVLVLRACEYLLAVRSGSLTYPILHFPFTFFIGDLFSSLNTSTIVNVIWVASTIKIVISMLWFVTVSFYTSMGVAWHRFLAFINLYAKREYDDKKSLGAAQNVTIGEKILTVDTVEEVDEDTPLGVGRIQDFTWKGLLDFNTCTECGRCQEICPAWNAGKPLSPKMFTMSLRDHHAQTSPFLLAAKELQNTSGDSVSQDLEEKLNTPIVPNVISEDILWACTMCGACTDQCPVDIEHVDHFLDLRRNQVLMESTFPTQLGKMFKKLESKGNPWGLPVRKRADWMKGLDFDIPVLGVDIEDACQTEYLFWVGCAGAYDDKAKKTTVAVATLLHLAEVDFAVLGEGESCTGDPARRSGNELLFQTLAAMNIEVLNDAKVKKIVVTCAHCFNTIANEYPSLGGKYEVLHHTQLLNRLIREGSLKLSTNYGSERKITYHDPCYLGRHNGVYDEPRQLLEKAGFTSVEMAHSKERALCCGAGGANAFIEDKSSARISDLRSGEVLATGACALATGCPFCTVMLNDVSTQNVEVKDIAVYMLESVLAARTEELGKEKLEE